MEVSVQLMAEQARCAQGGWSGPGSVPALHPQVPLGCPLDGPVDDTHFLLAQRPLRVAVSDVVAVADFLSPVRGEGTQV